MRPKAGWGVTRGRARVKWGDSRGRGRVCSPATQGSLRALGDGEVAPKLEGKVKYMSAKPSYVCESLAGDATSNHHLGGWGGASKPRGEHGRKGTRHSHVGDLLRKQPEQPRQQGARPRHVIMHPIAPTSRGSGLMRHARSFK